ncbi:MAG: response regulator [Firmicutes bacterium]|nr:response regulator [Bacillota bacterium]
MAQVLVADDSAFVRLYLARLIEGQGHVAILAEDGAEAVRQYEIKRPELVLMDLAMPNMDGFTAVRQILMQDPDATIVAVTAMNHDGAVQEALRAGVRHVLTKPLEEAAVLETLHRFLPAGR